MEQPNLFGFEAPPPRLKRPVVPREGRCRLFFALLPGQAAVEQMLELGTGIKSQYGLTGRLHAANRLHLTLDHMGDFKSMPEGILKAAREAADELHARSAGFPVTLERMVSFGRNTETRPLVLADWAGANPVLKGFREKLWDALATRGVPGGSRNSFTPHVTLLYDATVVPEQPISAVSWQASEFVLVESTIGESRYELQGRWPLQGG